MLACLLFGDKKKKGAENLRGATEIIWERAFPAENSVNEPWIREAVCELVTFPFLLAFGTLRAKFQDLPCLC